MLGGGGDARQAEQRARRIVGMDGHAHAGLLGGRHDLLQEAGQVGLQARFIDIPVARQHAAQALDVVAVEGAGQAGHDGGEQALLVGIGGGVEPRLGAGQNFGRIVAGGTLACQHVHVEGGELVGVEA